MVKTSCPATTGVKMEASGLAATASVSPSAATVMVWPTARMAQTRCMNAAVIRVASTLAAVEASACQG